MKDKNQYASDEDRKANREWAIKKEGKVPLNKPIEYTNTKTGETGASNIRSYLRKQGVEINEEE